MRERPAISVAFFVGAQHAAPLLGKIANRVQFPSFRAERGICFSSLMCTKCIYGLRAGIGKEHWE